jgi:hypothetical protein
MYGLTLNFVVWSRGFDIGSGFEFAFHQLIRLSDWKIVIDYS